MVGIMQLHYFSVIKMEIITHLLLHYIKIQKITLKEEVLKKLKNKNLDLDKPCQVVGIQLIMYLKMYYNMHKNTLKQEQISMLNLNLLFQLEHKQFMDGIMK